MRTQSRDFFREKEFNYKIKIVPVIRKTKLFANFYFFNMLLISIDQEFKGSEFF